ncbi:hypothetical protein Tco_0665854 [Tanacetum coccineum]
MAAEVPQILEYMGDQLDDAPVLEVENFTNCKKRFKCHIIGIEPQFENIILNGPYIPKAAGERKQEVQWTPDERKTANLDQRLKSLIMSVLPDDQMNSGPSDVKESRVMDLKLCYNTFKFKKSETIAQTFIRNKALMNELVNDDIKLLKLEINTGFINGLPKKWLAFCQSLRNTNHLKESELASLFGKLKYKENLIDNIYETDKKKNLVSATSLSTAFFYTSIVQDFKDSPDDEEDTRSKVSSDDNEAIKVKALMALADEERVSVGKESARTGEWVKVSMKKVDTLLKMEDNDDRKSFLDYLSDNSMMSIPDGERPCLFEAEDLILPNHDADRILLAESQRKTTYPPVAFTDSLATDYDSADKSSVCSTPLPPQERLVGAELVFGPKTIKLILKSNFTFKAKALKVYLFFVLSVRKSITMTRSTVKRLTKPLDEPEREFRRLRKAAMRSHQNKSLAIAGRNLFDDEASSSYNTGAKPPTPPKTLHEHSHPNSSGFLNPITFPTKEMGRIIDSCDIWLIQNTRTF